MRDDRWPVAKAYQRAAQVAAIALGMVVPGFVGYWVDRRIGTLPVVTILGFAAGLAYGILQLVQVSKSREADDVPPEQANHDGYE